MALDQSFVGRTYPPTPAYEVAREKIREFAEAIGDPHPAYRDPEAAKELGYPDVIAPPTFPIVISMPAADQVVYDPALGLDWTRVVHGDQRFTHERPMRPGDRVRATVVVESIKSFAGNDMITLVTEMSTEEGELISTARALLVARAENAAEEG
ncbi:MaoC family dehydratase N-terminal domain-containing protein [Actinospica robiniae]|uniref:MaoC family dehydratase N-terminal domain-containing protein n=1 Tax=Actinospica robiniae TaxID=304901 RepID=UPI0004257AF5|nr:MaoC family dehydratase N-terminal domain-containing protein [Actinospica robiniae]